MKLFLLVLISVLPFAGCTTKSKANDRARAAFLAGQNAASQAAPQTLTVTIFGPVRNPVIAWTEDLTLAKAIVAADYQQQWNPKAIFVRRGGQEFPVSPSALLRGDDVPLEPRDEIIINP